MKWYHGNLFPRVGLRRNCECGRTVWLNEDEAKREARKLRDRYRLRLHAVRCKGRGNWHVGVKP